MEVHPQARPLAKSRRVGPHRGPPTPWSTRLLATGHPHLARSSKESQGCCWWVVVVVDSHIVKQVPCLLPASSSRGGSHFNVGDACVGVCAICDGEISRKFQVSSKKGNTLGQPNPVQKFGKKGQDGAVQNCCPIFGDPKVTF